MTLVPAAGWRHPEVREVLRLARPSAGYAALNGGRLGVLLLATAAVPGGVVAFETAMNFSHTAVALGARPVSQAILPHLSRFHHRRDTNTFTDEYRRGLVLVAFIAVPAAIALLALPMAIAEGIAFGEMANVTGVALLTGSLASIAGSVIGEGVIVIGTHAAYAR